MIDLYSGTPGSGKSLHTAQVIKSALLLKMHVVCNFAISEDVRNYSYFTYFDNTVLTPKALIDYVKVNQLGCFNPKKGLHESDVLLVIDESQLLFNAREWGKEDRAEWLSFFTQHRKLGYHIVLVALFDRMLDRQIRSLVEYEYVHRKVSNFGIKGKLLSLCCGGKMFVAVKVWYPMHQKVGSSFYKCSKRLYRIYDTNAIF